MNNHDGWLKKIWKSLGPGLITGASDDDPSGIATYSIAGAKFGLSMLWMALFTLPFMIVIQKMAGREKPHAQAADTHGRVRYRKYSTHRIGQNRAGRRISIWRINLSLSILNMRLQ